MQTQWKTRVKAVKADTAEELAEIIEKMNGNPKIVVQNTSQPYYADGSHIVIVTVRQEEVTE